MNNRLEEKIGEDSWRNARVQLHPASIIKFKNAECLKDKMFYIIVSELKDCNYLQVINLYEDNEEIFLGKKINFMD